MKSLITFIILLCSYPLFAAPTGGDQATKSYSARGVVEKIAPDLTKITIHHQTIPGYMMEMTMDFPVKNPKELTGISLRDEIAFTLVVGADQEWIEAIHRIGRSAEATASATPMQMEMSSGMKLPELKPGDPMPDCPLTAEDGKQIRLSDFHGKAVAFVFFFTRCPLPDYCPRMNRNFEQTRRILMTDSSAPANWQFLSISFDPGFDTPEVLTQYANTYRSNDATRWLFAAASAKVLADIAPRLDLMITRQGNNISHNLRTVVLDPAGRVYKQFDGNEWTPQQLADAISRAAHSTGR